jgi:hypothetical protein
MSPYIDTADFLPPISRPPVAQSSKLAYTAIESALADSGMLTGYNYTIFRTGSERNQTNITDSDVDFLIGIPDVPNRRFEHWSKFSRIVQNVLTEVFSDSVSRTTKCINIEGVPLLPSIDLMPCLVRGVSGLDAHDGDLELPGVIEFWTAQDEPESIVNYPNAHLKNGTVKDQRTDGEYKRVVRVLKAQKNELVAEGEIEANEAYSYHIECLVHAVPDEVFKRGINESVQAAVGQITSPSHVVLQAVNQSYDLFGNSTLHWQHEKAQRFARAHRQI